MSNVQDQTGKKKRAQKTTPSQKQFLVQYLLDNSILVTRKFSSSFTLTDYNRGWEQLKNQLNDLGPPKDVTAWRKYWLDLKRTSKLAASQLYSSQKITGGGEGVPVEILTPTKQKIVHLAGGSTAVVGDSDVPVFGFDDECDDIIVPPAEILTSAAKSSTTQATPSLLPGPSTSFLAPSSTSSSLVQILPSSSQTPSFSSQTPSFSSVPFKNVPVVLEIDDDDIENSENSSKNRKSSIRKDLFEAICPLTKKLKRNSERGIQIELSPKKERTRKIIGNSSRDQRELIDLQKEHNNLLSRRIAIEEEKLKLKATKVALLEARNDIESKKLML